MSAGPASRSGSVGVGIETEYPVAELSIALSAYAKSTARMITVPAPVPPYPSVPPTFIEVPYYPDATASVYGQWVAFYTWQGEGPPSNGGTMLANVSGVVAGSIGGSEGHNSVSSGSSSVSIPTGPRGD